MTVVEIIRNYMLANGITEPIYIGHAPAAQFEKNHYVLSKINNSTRSGDGVQKFFDDDIRIIIIDTTSFESLEAKRLLLDSILIGVHLTDEIIFGTRTASPNPERINSQVFGWYGVYNFKGRKN